MTLRIYPVAIQLCGGCAPCIARIARHDRNLAGRIRRAVTGVPLNISESDGQRGGNRVQRRLTALGSARETKACLEIAAKLGYIERLRADVVDRMNHIIGVLVNVTR